MLTDATADISTPLEESIAPLRSALPDFAAEPMLRAGNQEREAVAAYVTAAESVGRLRPLRAETALGRASEARTHADLAEVVRLVDNSPASAASEAVEILLDSFSPDDLPIEEYEAYSLRIRTASLPELAALFDELTGRVLSEHRSFAEEAVERGVAEGRLDLAESKRYLAMIDDARTRHELRAAVRDLVSLAGLDQAIPVVAPILTQAEVGPSCHSCSRPLIEHGVATPEGYLVCYECGQEHRPGRHIHRAISSGLLGLALAHEVVDEDELAELRSGTP